MRGQCCICTELFVSDSAISAAQCGHTFHAHCLGQWIETSKTCPHCRKSINKKYVVEKLFFDSADDGRGDADEDVASLTNKLAECRAKEREKEKQIREKEMENKALQNKMDELQESFRNMNQLYKEERSNNSALKKELRFQKELQKEADFAVEEAKMLRNKLKTLENVEKVVKGNEDEIQKLLSGGDVRQLATWCSVLQKELYTKRQEVRSLRETTEKLKKENTWQRKSLSEKTELLSVSKEQLNIREDEIKDADSEVMKLKKKIDALQKALGSPSDTVRSFAHRLINESPAPMMSPPTKKPRLSHDGSGPVIELNLDTSADMFDSPDTETRIADPSPNTQRRKECTEYGTKFVKITSAASMSGPTVKPKPEIADISNIPGMGNFNLFKKKTGMGLADSGSAIRKGYNGLGGHEKFITTSSNPFKAPAPLKKKVPKFGPSKTLNKKQPPLPTLNFPSFD